MSLSSVFSGGLSTIDTSIASSSSSALPSGDTETTSRLVVDDASRVLQHCVPNMYGKYPVHAAAYYGDVLLLQTFLHLRKELVRWRDSKGATPLHHAAYSGSQEACKLLMDAGALLEVKDNSGNSPLQMATAQGNYGVVKYLIECGADVNSCDKHAISPLHRAATAGFTKIVNELLNALADCNAEDYLGRTALHGACVKSNDLRCENILGPLLDRGADPFKPDKSGLTPWHKAAATDNSGALVFLQDVAQSKRRRANAEDTKAPDAWQYLADQNGFLPLHTAVIAKATNCLYSLVENPKVINAPDKHGFTPLFYACIQGDLSTAQLLVKHGADVNAISREEKSSPLLKACWHGDEQCVQFLLDAGAKLKHVDKQGSGVFHKAAHQGHTKLVRFLLSQKDADITALDGMGSSPLHCAATGGHSSLINVMLLGSSKIDVNLANQSGATALHNAARSGDLTSVKGLLDRGADCTIADKNGSLPLHLAAVHCFYEVVDLLCDHGAKTDKFDLNTKDGANNTALFYALKRHSNETVRVLLTHRASVEDRELYEPLLASDQLDLVRVCEELPAEVALKLNEMPLLKEKLADALILDSTQDDLGPPPDLTTFQVDADDQIIFDEALVLFNEKPHKAIKLLIEKKVVPRHPREIARMLYIYRSNPLDLVMIGDYLGSDGKFETAVRRYYTSFVQMTGIDFDLALRRFLRTFRLPGEGQKIDRLVETFGHRYYIQNKEDTRIQVCASKNAAFRLAYVMVMLNTDAHNPNVRKEEKMTLPQFIANCAEQNDGTDFPKEYLTDLYERIVSNEIDFHSNSAFANAAKSGWLFIRLKRIGRGHRYKRRFFYLVDNELTYVKSPASDEVLGVIDVSNLMTSKPAQNASAKKKIFPFELIANPLFSSPNAEPIEPISLRAETERDSNAWMEAITTATMNHQQKAAASSESQQDQTTIGTDQGDDNVLKVENGDTTKD